MSRLVGSAGDAAFIFVTGKGGVGKTTAAGALALELADTHGSTHLISTDPAHSLGDLFEQDPAGRTVVVSDCSSHLTLEELDASERADVWLQRWLPAVTEIVESGTYLDGEDVIGFSRLALPGLDEMMAVQRLAELARERSGTVVVDTAPTGHMLRMLDAAATYDGIARALRAMADKAGAVAGSLAGRTVRFTGEAVIDELNECVATFRAEVLGRAAFIVVTRPGAVVAAETARLARALERRGLNVVATIATTGDAPGAGGVCVQVPRLPHASGCAGLRDWRAALQPCARASAARPAAPAMAGAGASAQRARLPAPPWLHEHAPRMLLFAGKGGVGKSTCAAAAAVTLAEQRDVLLCGVDPAGSLHDVLALDPAAPGPPAPRLRVLQIEPETEFQRLGEAYREDVLTVLEQVGLGRAAELDRRVIEAVWELAPPGIDELAAVAAMLAAAGTHETVIVDAAPTGHFLRLLTMPDVALDWTHQLMRVIVKYGIAGSADGAAAGLLRLARELRALREWLHDAERAAAIVVTLPEPLVEAETRRLLESLSEGGIRVAAVLCNRATAAATVPYGDTLTIVAPDIEPPVGVDALRKFVWTWNIVE